jgi:hypothetical protein
MLDAMVLVESGIGLKAGEHEPVEAGGLVSPVGGRVHLEQSSEQEDDVIRVEAWSDATCILGGREDPS